MKTRSTFIAALLFGVSVMACGHAVSAPPPHYVPMISVSEDQDEWLYDHCESKGVLAAESDAAADPMIRAKHANFAEIVHTDSTFHAVAFACRTRPDWADEKSWIPLEAIAQRVAVEAPRH